MSNHNGATLKKMSFNGEKVKKWYHNDVKVYSAGNIVTYYVDSGTSYQEEVDSDATCLSPQSFTPTKSGWTFVGWREDTTANASVLSSKIMGDNPISLYAVFRQTITLSTVANSVTSNQTGTRYYNNGTTINPTFTVANPTKSGATFNGWSTSASSTTISNSSISGLSLSASATRYAVFTYANANIDINTSVYQTFPSGNTPLYSPNLTHAIDCSKYRGVTMTIRDYPVWFTAEWANGRSYYGWLTGGGGQTLLASHYNDNDDDEGESFNYPGGTVTVNFTQTSGSTYMRFLLTCDRGDGQAGHMQIYPTFTCTALGRTVVG